MPSIAESGGEGKESVSKEKKGEFYDGCEPVKCPNPSCGQELMDLDEDFFDPGPPEIKCRRCGEPAEQVGHINSDLRPGKCTYMFKCVPCNVKFTRKIPGMRRRCPNCNEKFYMFWNLLLGLPPRSSNRPRRKAALQSA